MTLPFLGFVTGFLISVTIVAGLAGILTHYLYGSIRIMERGIFTSRAAQIHLAVTGAAFLLLLGINFWLDRYSTVQNNGGRWAGALYTDVNAVIPTKAILAVAAVIVAVLFIVAAVIGKWRLAGDRHRHAGHHGHPRRRRLPLGHPAVPGPALGTDPGNEVHQAEHRHDPCRLRAG